MIMRNEMEVMWKEAIVTGNKIPPGMYLERLNETSDNCGQDT